MTEQELLQAANEKRVEARKKMDVIRSEGRIEAMTDDEAGEVERLNNEANDLANRAKKVSRYDSLRAQVDDPIDQFVARQEVDPLPHTDRVNTRNGKHRLSVARALYQLSQTGYVGHIRGIEGEIHQEMIKRHEHLRGAQGFLLPFGDFGGELGETGDVSRADEITTTITGAGALNKTVMPSIIEKVRARISLTPLGMRTYTLNGATTFPRFKTGATVAFKGEAEAQDATKLEYDSIELRPRRVTSHVQHSGEFLKQAIGNATLEGTIYDDIIDVTGAKFEETALIGTGTGNVPAGITATTGVQTVVFGSGNGGAPTYAKVLEIEKKIRNAIPSGALSWVTTNDVRAKLKTTEKLIGAQFSQPLLSDDDVLIGYKLVASGLLPSNYTAGTGTGLSPLIFGDFSQLIMATFGAIEFRVDPMTLAAADLTRFIMHQYVDFGVRRPDCFCKTVDVVTV